MGKPRMMGMINRCIPNSKADMRFRRKIYQRGREIAERDPSESRATRPTGRKPAEKKVAP